MDRERTIAPEDPALGVPQDNRLPVTVAAFAGSAEGREVVAFGPEFIRRRGMLGAGGRHNPPYPGALRDMTMNNVEVRVGR
jgi:hypothetical protein